LSVGENFLESLNETRNAEPEETYFFQLKLGWVSSFNVARQAWWEGFFVMGFEKFLSEKRDFVKISVQGVNVNCSNPENCSSSSYSHYKISNDSHYEGGSLSLFNIFIENGFSVAGGGRLRFSR
jgi:hypothetical protein